ncbi:hypothetical protein MSKOL_0586 [Methanosarcina sp. Kolksee]|nr:hypothetical protein MSKOL_0586 [Methanosarcina sp. Kolksee]
MDLALEFSQSWEVVESKEVVSILVLVDLALEFYNISLKYLKALGVSILVLVDLALECITWDSVGGNWYEFQSLF